MTISQFTIGTSRTINLGNFESLRIEASVTVDVNDSENYRERTVEAQAELRQLLELTYRSQTKSKTGEKVA